MKLQKSKFFIQNLSFRVENFTVNVPLIEEITSLIIFLMKLFINLSLRNTLHGLFVKICVLWIHMNALRSEELSRACRQIS